MPAEIRSADHPLAGVDGPGVRVLTIANPQKKGAVDAASLHALSQEAARATRDGVRALVLTGEPGLFCSGFDLGSLDVVDAPDAIDALAHRPRADSPLPDLPDAPLGAACAALEACAPPIVCAIDGATFGAGVELACACDLRIAAPGLKFSLPPAKLGVVYSPDGTQRVLRLLGPAQTRRLFLTAATLDSEEALRIGLVDEVLASPLERALALANQMAALSPQSVQGMKQLIHTLTSAQLTQPERAHIESLRRQSFASDDAKEGRAAFAERRPPSFTGR